MDRIVPARLAGPADGVGRVSAIAEGEAGELWIGGRFGVMHLHVEPHAPEATVMFARPSLDRREIYRIIRDHSGSTWVGTRGAGLVRLAPRRVWHLTEAGGLSGREVNHVVGDGEGGVWLGGSCTGIMRVAFAGSSEVRRLPLARFGECATAFTTDGNGGLWAAFPGHIVRISGDDEREPRSWGADRGLDPQARVTALAAGSDGSVWFGYDLGGLGVVRDSSVVLFEPGGWLPAERIYSLLYDPVGELWVGQSGTVARVPLRGGAIGEPRVLTREDGVPPGAVRFIHRDRARQVWIGSYGGGIARCTPDGTAFDRLTTTQGLPDNSVSSLLEDDQDRFWLLGNRGVAVVARAVLDSVLAGHRARIDAVSFDAEDGVPEGNAGSPAAWLDAEGIAWFATIDGLVAIDTRGFPFDTVVPVPRIEGVRFGGEPWDGALPVVIGGGAREVGFSYSSSSASTPRGAMYRYRLGGQDDDWVYADDPGIARYPRVPPGTYRFELEARNEDGVWSSQPATFDFRILPVWWETAWFRGGGGLLLAALIGAGLIRRVRNAERRTRQLELAIVERERAEEKVRSQQRELEHVSRIATAGELATSLAHELNQPLMAIVSNAAASDRLLSNPDIGREIVREALSEIITEGKRASDVIKELREFLRRGSVDTERLRVNQLVRDVLLLLGSEIREARVDVGLDLAGDLASVDGNRVQLQQILVNLIMNALDALRPQEGERRIVVRTQAADPWVEILIRDNGPGLPSEGAETLFEAFVTTKSNGMGVGLAICRTLAQAHGGRIVARNHPDGGAEFLLTLPPAPDESGRTDAADRAASVSQTLTERTGS
jgi:signal transduction histidine kinase/streptogramin lyase